MASAKHRETAGGAALADVLEKLRPPPPAAGRQRPAVQRGLVLAIFAGGVAGALARGGLEAALPADGRSWPWATFLANVGGALLLGFVATRLQERLPPSTFPRPLLGTGFCGALTTFSTFQLELLELVRHGHAALAAAYLGASLAAGLAGVQIATALVRRGRIA